MQLAGKDGARKRGAPSAARSNMAGLYSAAMLMEMSAALAEWVSAPTLIKSTPVSA